MQISKHKFILCLVGSFLLGICLVGSVFAYKISAPSSSNLISEDKINEINEYIDKYFLEDYDEEKLNEGAYKGYVAALNDPYSVYMNKEEYDSWQTSSLGTYSGVGITFSMNEDEEFVVVSVSEDSPADKAGIQPGDILVSVDGVVYSDSDKMATNIRGKNGTKVTIQYESDGKAKEATLKREVINQKSVEYRMLDSKTGYIKITQFVDKTSDDFKSALDSVTDKGAKKLVLDLRDNGGGLVDESVSIADEFLDKGVVCYVKDKNGNSETYDAKDGKTDLETVVLVNENSASASEILAGAMKDNGYTIVGEKTFGKGIIQTSFELSDGSALELTIMQYFSPDKHKIHKNGIKPTIKAKDNKKTEKDEQLDKAKEIVKNQ